LEFGLLPQQFTLGVILGLIYCLMALGISFIFSVMKMINWAMGGFYMIGGYATYLTITLLVGPNLWYIAILISMAVVFIVGIVFQTILLKPMYSEIGERKAEYATIVTIAAAILMKNLIAVAVGPRFMTPPPYYPSQTVLGVPVDGTKIMALISTLFILIVFYIILKKTWTGRALLASAQNRLAAQVAGIDVEQMDKLAFGVGVAFAGAAGGLLAPVFPLYAGVGDISTLKGFVIIVIGGVGSLAGSVIGALMLGIVETLGGVLISSSFRDVYGFVAMVLILLLRPTGLLGEKTREV